MADGTFAVLMLVLGLTDMGMNHCRSETGCLGHNETTPRLAFSGGEVLERQADTQSEVYFRYDLATKLGPFGNAVGLSYTEGGAIWVGVGQTYKMSLGNTPLYAELHAMPGLYLDTGGFGLGGPIEFRSGLELGYENRAGWRFAASYDHRSNAGIYDENPGIETVQFKVSMPLR